ncbi:Scr1 family TA system antitoxin-like transcriptional regulator [Streptomyces sp. NPDC020965]|uniref:Scr1 family TA system antitoxin-like transcriptional regulator n=1 Tax=Streptomyces sp. NPDC020965 TaxID=3365105 RepID=UPI00379E51DE
MITTGPARPGRIVAGAYLRTLRMKADLTPHQAAARAHCSYPTLQRVETGRSTADAHALERLTDLYLPNSPEQAAEIIALAALPKSVGDTSDRWNARLTALEYLAGTIVLASINMIPAVLRCPSYEQFLRDVGDAPAGSRALPPDHGKNVVAYLHEDAIRRAGTPDMVGEQAAHLLAGTADVRVILRDRDGLSEYLPLRAGVVYGQLWIRPTPLYTVETLNYGVRYPDDTDSSVSAKLDLCRTRAATRADSRAFLRTLIDDSDGAEVPPVRSGEYATAAGEVLTPSRC